MDSHFGYRLPDNFKEGTQIRTILEPALHGRTAGLTYKRGRRTL
jgi:hypothetical protein